MAALNVLGDTIPVLFERESEASAFFPPPSLACRHFYDNSVFLVAEQPLAVKKFCVLTVLLAGLPWRSQKCTKYCQMMWSCDVIN